MRMYSESEEEEENNQAAMKLKNFISKIHTS